jgi:hypothetical protein
MKSKTKNKEAQETKLNIIKLTIARLFMVGGIWSVSLMLYNLSDFENVSFPIIVMRLFAVYFVGEIILMFCEIKQIKK